MSTSAEEDAAAVGRDLAGELPDQRGLAGAIRADDRVQLAPRNRERNVIRCDDTAELLDEPLDPQQCIRHGRPREHAVDAAAREQHDQQKQRTQQDPASIPPCVPPPLRTAGWQPPVLRSAAPPPTSNTRTAPNSGPNDDAMPPRTTMTIRSPERVQCMVAGLMNPV